jgi:hypothetical protein
MIVQEVHNLKWSFDGGDPYFEYGGWPEHPFKAHVDPFPGYGHNPSVIRYLADQIETAVPLKSKISIYLSNYELIQRCNGFAQDFGETGAIVLSGKRQPIVPQMTWYILGHEYGHHVEFALDGKYGHGETAKDYFNLRPRANSEYGARKWHSNIRELFANDFRILVLGHEVDYWPHPGFKHPKQCPDIVEYWEEKIQLIKGEKL